MGPLSRLSSANLFELTALKGEGEQFDELLSGGAFRLERIISKGNTTPDGEWYDQGEDEWVLLMSGGAKLEYQYRGNLESIELKPGDHVLIPAHTRHRVAWTRPDVETIWLALHFINKAEES